VDGASPAFRPPDGFQDTDHREERPHLHGRLARHPPDPSPEPREGHATDRQGERQRERERPGPPAARHVQGLRQEGGREEGEGQGRHGSELPELVDVPLPREGGEIGREAQDEQRGPRLHPRPVGRGERPGAAPQGQRGQQAEAPQESCPRQRPAGCLPPEADVTGERQAREEERIEKPQPVTIRLAGRRGRPFHDVAGRLRRERRGQDSREDDRPRRCQKGERRSGRDPACAPAAPGDPSPPPVVGNRANPPADPPRNRSARKCEPRAMAAACR
jgi:hypothetical protein